MSALPPTLKYCIPPWLSFVFIFMSLNVSQSRLNGCNQSACCFISMSTPAFNSQLAFKRNEGDDCLSPGNVMTRSPCNEILQIWGASIAL